MKNMLLTLGAFVAAGMLALGVAGNATAQDMQASHPAHIHTGSCAELGDVIAPLSNISNAVENNGTPLAMDMMMGSAAAIPVAASITTVDLALADIVAAEHAINIHESEENIQNYIACGDIGGMMIGEADLIFGIAELNSSGMSGVASLHDNGDGTTTVYVYLMGGEGGMATPVGSPQASPVS